MCAHVNAQGHAANMPALAHGHRCADGRPRAHALAHAHAARLPGESGAREREETPAGAREVRRGGHVHEPLAWDT